MDEQKQDHSQDLDETEATVLPAREAMSLITPDTGTPNFIPDLGPETSPPDGIVTTQDAASDAQGSASGEETASDQDQSTHTSSQDTATSQT